MTRCFFGKLILLFGLSPLLAHSEVLNLNYGWFRIQLDCATKSAIGWQYTAVADTNNYPRHENFYFDQAVPSRCQQTSQNTYKSDGEVKYDRGHLVPANVMDSSPESIRLSNMMTNVLPQAAQMNRGAWYQTELWVECRRDIAPVSVYGGVWQGQVPQDGDFRISHGVVAPEAFYKIAVQGNSVIAWWIPNHPAATKARVDDYIVTISEIESWTGLEFPIPSFLKDIRPEATNAHTATCRRG
ncbi:DNA/RNA non-specific endonuclease [Vibrio harveyi]|uniref:DNA/RNA non-specific endonuclease n=1 Tax=Vibrio harveyi TaxID=669 RepID=UPI002480AC54|nr:DNA/RNA non-specific endonuclease [Vibrio harveyi]